MTAETDGRFLSRSVMTLGGEFRVCFDRETGKGRIRVWLKRGDGLGLFRTGAIGFRREELPGLIRALQDAKNLLDMTTFPPPPGPNAGPHMERRK